MRYIILHYQYWQSPQNGVPPPPPPSQHIGYPYTSAAGAYYASAITQASTTSHNHSNNTTDRHSSMRALSNPTSPTIHEGLVCLTFEWITSPPLNLMSQVTNYYNWFLICFFIIQPPTLPHSSSLQSIPTPSPTWQARHSQNNMPLRLLDFSAYIEIDQPETVSEKFL